jgi:flavin reductase (DIM6/NTAB) family NADH-FMN oxidoreductase RutF
MLKFSLSDIQNMERIARLTLVNAITGFKSGNLIGTVDSLHDNFSEDKGLTNLAIFSSAIHIGSDPPLIGIVTRPVTPDGKTSRHTYDNIKNTGFFTINHVNSDIIEQAHQTSASYEDGISEFKAVGLTPQYLGLKNVPYVLESHIKMGLEYVEEYYIKANNTIMIIGKVIELILPEDCLDDKGNLDLNAAKTVAVTGLDTYHVANQVSRLPYARVKRS